MSDILLFLAAASLWVVAAVQTYQAWKEAIARDPHPNVEKLLREQIDTVKESAERVREWEQKHGEAHRELGKTLHTHKTVKEEATPVEHAH